MDYTRRMGRKALGKERINITLPKGMADELLEAAAKDGRDRSDLIAELAREYLQKRRSSARKVSKGDRRA
jgi:metal-responsive CopG/Arc/MetJ family transcriptional regulator